MTPLLEFRAAVPAEAPGLSRLAVRAKAHWGYPPAFMQACRQELAVSSRAIAAPDRHYVVAVEDERIIGFYALEDQREERIELGAMFVEPRRIGTGVGRQLMQRAMVHAAQLGARRLEIQSDPNALAFYQAAGARCCGERESESVPGRMLPLLQLDLSATTAPG